MPQWIVPATIAFTAWGLWAFLPKLAVTYMSPKSIMVYEILGAIIVGMVILWSMDFRVETHPKGIILAIITGALGFAGSLAFVYALARGPVSVVSMFSALYPILTVTLAYLFLNEMISLKQAVGIALALVAIYLLSS
ncbi:MAG: DMT family transporter [Gammaproteobacteria bacterium]|nr:DMT family transporter [Gammaproteobacteria bacterium]MDH5799463.1 DMT family transporter [Gammaproteobacteria bacterium]